MPRPKPIDPIKSTSIRLTTKHQIILRQLGGSEWIRKMLDKHAPLPKSYYDARSQSQEENTRRA
jgi:hypothetical protein